jgi:hypothetical protein
MKEKTRFSVFIISFVVLNCLIIPFEAALNMGGTSSFFITIALTFISFFIAIEI